MIDYKKLWEKLYKMIDESVTEEWYSFNITDMMDDLLEQAELEED